MERKAKRFDLEIVVTQAKQGGQLKLMEKVEYLDHDVTEELCQQLFM